MTTPVGTPSKPLEKRRLRSSDVNKENAGQKPPPSPRNVPAGGVLQQRPPSPKVPCERFAQFADIVKSSPEGNPPPLVKKRPLPRKRRFEEPPPSSTLSPLADNDHSRRADTCEPRKKTRWNRRPDCDEDVPNESGKSRVNPFDKPLTKVTQTAPRRAYRQPCRTLPPQTGVMDPPPRRPVCYADLWDGVYAIDRRYEHEDLGGELDGEYLATYDFLYDGVWKRCVGNFVVPVEKEDVGISPGGMNRYWQAAGRGQGKREQFSDLDRPEKFSLSLDI